MGKYSKKILTAIWVTALAVFLLILLGMALIQLRPVQKWAGRAIASSLSKSTGLIFSIDAVRYFPLSTIQISNICVADTDSTPIATINRALADVNIPLLLSSHTTLDLLQVDTLDLQIWTLDDGSLNIQKLFSPRDTDEASGANISLHTLRIKQGAITYTPATTTPLHVADLNVNLDDLTINPETNAAHVRNLSLRLPDHGDTHVNLTATIQQRADTIAVTHATMTADNSHIRIDSVMAVVDTTGVTSAVIKIPSILLTPTVITRLTNHPAPQTSLSLYATLDAQILNIQKLQLNVGDATKLTSTGLAQIDRLDAIPTWGRLTVDGKISPADIAQLLGIDNPIPAPHERHSVDLSANALLDNKSGEASIGANLTSRLANLTLYATAHTQDNWANISFDTKANIEARPAAHTDIPLQRIDAAVSAQGTTTLDAINYATLKLSLSGDITPETPLPTCQVNGVVDHKQFNALLNVNDPVYGHLIAIAELDHSTPIPYASVTMQADTLRLGHPASDVFTPDAWTVFRLRAETLGLKPQTAKADLHIADLYLANRQDTISTPDLIATLDTDTLGQRTLSITSDLIEASASGTLSIADIAAQLEAHFSNALPAVAHPTPFAHSDRQTQFQISIPQSHKLAAMFAPSVAVSDNLVASGNVDAQLRTMWARLDVDTLSFGGTTFTKLQAATTLNHASMAVGLHAATASFPIAGMVDNFMMNAEAERNIITTDADWNLPNTNRQGGTLNFQTTLSHDVSGELQALVAIDQSQLTIDGDTWTLDTCNVTFQPQKIQIDKFRIASADHWLQAGGTASTSTQDTLNLALSNIQLERLLKTDENSKYSLQGDLYATAHVTSALGTPRLLTQAYIDSLYVNGDNLQHLDLTTTWSPDNARADIGIAIVTDGRPRAIATGFLDIPASYLDIHFDIDSLSTGFLNFYLDACIDRWRGSTTGRLRLHGPLDDIGLDADLRMNDDNYFRVIQTGVSYHIDRDDSLTISPRNLVFHNIQFTDDQGGRAVFAGNINHDMFSNLQYHLDFGVNNTLLLQTTAQQSPSYYGTIHGSGKMLITGPTDAIHIGIDATTDPNTTFIVEPTAKSDISQQDYILFKKQDEQTEAQNDLLGQGLTADLNIHVTPDAEMTVVVNPQTDNKLTGRGQGQILVGIDRVGQLTMQGDYQIQSGLYNFSFENIINKQFAINQGSKIIWDGGPYDAIIDLTATYKLKASLYDLVQGTADDNSDLKRRVPVNCNIILTNKLTNPDIRFDIEIPSSQNFSQYTFDQYVNTQEEMNRQVFSLLLANKFYSPQDASSQTANQSTGYLGTTASELLSNQLSSLFSQNDRNIGVGVNYRPGDEVTNEEYELSLSTGVLNNKILLSGNIGYGRDASANSNGDGSLIGDFDVEVKLNKQGSIRAKAYTHSNNDVIYETSPTTQGVGISFQEEFNTFRELMRKYWEKLTRRKRRQTEAATDSVPSANTHEPASQNPQQ